MMKEGSSSSVVVGCAEKVGWILLTLFYLTDGRKLDAAATFGVTQGEEVFALPCPGITENFDSVIWVRHEENTLVGAGVNYNHEKYRYHASNGDLGIRNLEFGDAGIYRCIVTYGYGDKTIDRKRETRAVELVVSQPYRDLWQEEYKGNMIRGLIAAGVAATLVLAVCAIYKYRWKDSKYTRYSEELQLVSGMDNLGMEPEQQQRMGGMEERDSSSVSSSGIGGPSTSIS